MIEKALSVSPAALPQRTHKGAIFDLDGVLVDTARYHLAAWQRIAGEFGFSLTDWSAEAVKGVGRLAALEIVMAEGGITLSPEVAAKAAARKNAYYQESISNLDESALLPGSLESLEKLKSAGIGIALASASRNAGAILRSTGIEPMFDAIIDGTVVAAAKPDPAVFLAAARALRIDPAEGVVLEDAIAGLEGARRAGCTVIGIGDRSALREADLVVPTLAAVPWEEFFGKAI